MPFKSKLSLHHHRDGKGHEYVCPLTLGMKRSQPMRYQDNLFVIL